MDSKCPARKGSKICKYKMNRRDSKACCSYEEVLESSEVDAVYVPLPTALHLHWAQKAAQNKKHILLEKPIALVSICNNIFFLLLFESRCTIAFTGRSYIKATNASSVVIATRFVAARRGLRPQSFWSSKTIDFPVKMSFACLALQKSNCCLCRARRRQMVFLKPVKMLGSNSWMAQCEWFLFQTTHDVDLSKTTYDVHLISRRPDCFLIRKYHACYHQALHVMSVTITCFLVVITLEEVSRNIHCAEVLTHRNLNKWQESWLQATACRTSMKKS